MLKLIYCLFLIIASNHAFAKKTYTIGVQNFETYHPYSEFKDNRYRGFNRDLLDLFAKTQGFKFEYKARPIKRLYAEFIIGNFDFKSPDNARWALDIKANNKIYYSQAVVNYTDGLIVKKENIGKNLYDIEDSNGNTVETMQGIYGIDTIVLPITSATMVVAAKSISIPPKDSGSDAACILVSTNLSHTSLSK